MMFDRCFGASAVVIIPVLVAATQAVAAPVRARTLTYDSASKDWVEVAAPPAGTAAGDLHATRLLLKERRFRPALSKAKKIVKSYGETDAVHPDALIVQAEALIGLREYSKAHDVLQEFLNAYAGSAATSDALRLEMVIAEAFLSGAKRKVWGLHVLSGEDLAFRILDQISADNPDSRFAEFAIKTKADYLFRTGDHALAQLEYDRLQRDHPRGQYHSLAMVRSAESALASFAGVDYDTTRLVEAVERYDEYRVAYPTAAKRDRVDLVLDGIRETRAEKGFLTGRYYERTQHTRSAIFYFQRVRKDWPGTIAASKAAERLVILGFPDEPSEPVEP